MPINAVQRGRPRNAIAIYNSTDDVIAQYGAGGEPLSLNAGPLDMEIVRLGNSYQVIQGTAVAPVTALPTTTAQLSLYNGESAGGPSYIIESVLGIVVVSAAAATNIGCAGCINSGVVTQPTSGALKFANLSGAKLKTKAVAGVGQTITNDGWYPIGSSQPAQTSNAAATFEWPLQGRIIVPPGGMFSISLLANTASTITTLAGLIWHEARIAVNPNG